MEKVIYRGKMPVGYAICGYSPNKCAYKLCIWFLFPLFWLFLLLNKLKYKLYTYLNLKGLMHSPEFEPMRFKHLFTKKEAP
jgi:hypothetical protein